MTTHKIRVLVLGASGMLGSTMFRFLARNPQLETFGSIREATTIYKFPPQLQGALISNIHMEGESGLLTAFSIAKPDIVINCIGIIKQLPAAKDHMESLAINSMLPHRLAKYCQALNARLVHFSTDCVFSGNKGMYREEDIADANDLYGRTKFMGELDYINSITIRTSVIGHELYRAKSLVDWFLSQTGEVNGFTNAIFSGLPAIEIARVVNEHVIHNHTLKGLYHLSVDPINKFDLLALISRTYKKDIKIVPDGRLVIDRSLNSDRFRAATGFKPLCWSDLVNSMHEEYLLIN